MIVDLEMRLTVTLFWLFLLSVLPLNAQEADFEFRPGRSLGAAILGQSPKEVLKQFPGWTYLVDEKVIGASYLFPEKEPPQFILSFNTDDLLNEITIITKSIHLRNSPKIAPGCSMEAVQRKFGVPSTNTLEDEKFGGYWDYEHLGLCFHFDGTSRGGARHGAGNVDAITLYKPSESRFKR